MTTRTPQDQFYDACVAGDVSRARRLICAGDVDVHACHDSAFCLACGEGHWQVAKWLLDCGGVDVHARENDAFMRACMNNHLQTAKWLAGIMGPDHMRRSHVTAFLSACVKGSLEVAQWLVEVGGCDIVTPTVVRFAFWSACNGGHLEMATWLGSVSHVDLRADKASVFEGVCSRGNIHLVYWLLRQRLVHGEDVSSEGRAAFRAACGRGHLVFAQWLRDLAGLDEYDIHFDNDFAFRVACRDGHTRVAQWLVRLGGVNIHAETDWAFTRACDNGHLNTAKWLRTMGAGVNISNTFASACCRMTRNTCTLMWLWGMDPRQQSCCDFHLPTFTWLYQSGIALITGDMGDLYGRVGTTALRWLAVAGIMDVHVHDDRMFKAAVSQGNVGLGRWLISRDPHWDWPRDGVAKLVSWSLARGAWIHAVARAANKCPRSYGCT